MICQELNISYQKEEGKEGVYDFNQFVFSINNDLKLCHLLGQLLNNLRVTTMSLS